MKFFKRSHDGGRDSGVTGYWLIEWKPVFSIVILKFNPGSREAFHEHAFNAATWWLKGEVEEQFLNGSNPKTWRPSFIPKFTPRHCFHKIICKRPAWAISIRGPWAKIWRESKHGKTYTLTHGRKRVKSKGV